MISYQVYKVIHLLGIMMIFLSLGGIATQSINGSPSSYPWKKGASVTHGIGLVLGLVGGFGLLARLGFGSGLPGWAMAKLVIWTIFAGITAVFIRKPQFAKKLWLLIIFLGGCAAFLANYKPF